MALLGFNLARLHPDGLSFAHVLCSGLLATGLRQRFNQVLTPLFARLDYHGIAWPWSVDVISLPEERKHFDWALLATPALADLEPTFRRIQDHRSLMLHPVERFSPRLKNHAVWGDR